MGCADTRPGALRAHAALFVTAFLVLAADQASKTWICLNLDLDTYHPGESLEVLPGFLYIVHIGNEGAAWGLFSGYGFFLTLFALLALFLIYKFRHTLELHLRRMRIVFGLLVGGIIGNLIDRLLHGHVVDFIDVHLPFTIPGLIPDGRWPAFNVADASIVTGVVLYFLFSLFSGTAADPET